METIGKASRINPADLMRLPLWAPAPYFMCNGIINDPGNCLRRVWIKVFPGQILSMPPLLQTSPIPASQNRAMTHVATARNKLTHRAGGERRQCRNWVAHKSPRMCETELISIKTFEIECARTKQTAFVLSKFAHLLRAKKGTRNVFLTGNIIFHFAGLIKGEYVLR